jgi:RNA polymerase sigma-70 factor (ECF subfamily)
MIPERRAAIHEAICRLADGERSGMAQLVTELWPVLLEFARRGVPEQDAEDIAQEVFLRICARIAEFDRTRDGLSWAFGIASYAILTHRRRTQRRRESLGAPELEALSAPGSSQEELAIQRELRAALRAVLGEVSDDDLAHLGLVAKGPPANVSDAALRKRRQRALDRLRMMWRRLYGEP